MSHITKIKSEIKDLEILKKAVKELGLVFHENKNRYKWYGSYNSKKNTCDHAIGLKNGKGYEIGVIKKGDLFELKWDSFDNTLREAVGSNASKLTNGYTITNTIESSKAFAESNNFMWEEFVDPVTNARKITMTEY